jgi:hypothetical protein
MPCIEFRKEGLRRGEMEGEMWDNGMDMMRKTFVYFASTRGTMSRNATRVCGRNKSREKRRNVMAALGEHRMNGARMGRVNVKGLQSLLHGKRLEMRRFFSGCNSRRPGKRGSAVGFFVLHLQRFSIFIFFVLKRGGMLEYSHV